MSKLKTKTARQTAESITPKPAAVSLRRLLPVIVTLLFLIGIFLFPYRFPLKNASGSQSWEFGFNNTVAQGLIALLLLFHFAWQYFFGDRDIDQDAVGRALLAEDEPVPVRSLLLTMGILQMVSIAILVGWYAILPMSHYGELTYFIQRVEAVLLGRAPYVDFAFDYGPAMLSLPVGIYRAFHGAVSVEAAYAVTLIIHYVIGLALVAYVISQINARGRLLIFAIVGFQWINLTMGLNYTPLRFTVGLASVFAVRHLYRLTCDFPSRRAGLLALAGFLLPLLSFSLSPEMGLALTISLSVYFFWFLFGSERRLALLVLSVFAGVGAAVLIFPRPYFYSMLGFGKGGASFPIFPTIHILAFLAAAIWIFPRLGVFSLRDKSGAGPFCAALAVLFGLYILPATGRCDPGHIWVNSAGLFLVALAAGSWLKPMARYAIWSVYFIVFFVTNLVAEWDNYKDPIQSALTARSQLASVQYDPDNYAHLASGDPRPPIHYSKLLPMGGELLDLPKVKIGIPLGDNEILERYLKLNNREIPQYHIPPFGDIFGTSDLQEIYRDLRSMQYIFVPAFYLNYLRPVDATLQARAQAQADCKFMSGLLLFPVDLPLVHPLFQPDVEIMRHVATEYGLVKQYEDGVLLKRKD